MVAVASLSVVAHAQADASEVPQGCDGDALTESVAVIRDLVAKQQVCGAVVMVTYRGATVVHEALGFRDVASKQPMQADTLFRMASNTKAVTAAAVLTLVDEGKVSLDDPISKWFATWAEGDAKKVTVRQLLTHSSGLRIGTLFLRPLMTKSEEHPSAPNLVLECARFGEVGPKVEPGTTYSYSNPGYNMLAGLVEVVTGEGFEDYCAARFYQPLGMRDTNNHESRADNGRMSVVVRGRSKGRWRARWSPGDRATLPFVRGSGGLISTATDYEKFCRMVFFGGEVGDRRFLSRKMVEQATKNQIPHIKGGRYGFGWRIDPGATFSHSGSDGTFVWCDPARDLVGMVLTQTQASKPLSQGRQRFRKLVTAACAPLDASSRAPR